MLFDSHAHLTDERFATDLDEVVERARAAEVSRIVTVASDGGDAAAACALARRFEGVRATAGIHPHGAGGFAASMADIREIASQPEVVAIGETGLDYHYDHAARHAQLRAFEWHVGLAAETRKPLVVHSRDADADMAAMVRSAGVTTGVLHCFTGGTHLLETALEADWYISFSGLVSFPGFATAALVPAVPEERLLVETDSPYLAPVPRRGSRNEPAYVRYVAEKIAELRNQPFERIAVVTTRNALRFYALANDGRSNPNPA